MTCINTTTISDRGTITFPAKLRRKHHLEPGTEIVFVEDEGKLVIVPIKDFDTIKVDLPSKEEILKEMDRAGKNELELEE